MELTHLLLWCGFIAGPVFIALFLIEGALRDNYSPMRQPVSALSLGSRWWVQQLNFFSSSILLMAYAFGLSQALVPYGGSFWIPFLIAVYATGLFGAGVFVTDITGEHKDTHPHKHTVSGILHQVFSSAVFISLFAACFVFARLFMSNGLYDWAVYSILTGVFYGAGFVLFAAGFSRGSKLGSIAGLLQRATIAIGALFLSFAALYLL